MKLCFFTGSRADWASTRALCDHFVAGEKHEVVLIACGEWVSKPDQWLYRARMFPLEDQVRSRKRMVKDRALVAVAGNIAEFVAAAIDNDQPDLIFIIGDRWEAFTAAQVAYAMRTPIAHLFGGDRTAGSMDDGYRRAISQLATLHFVSNPDSWDRLRPMVEGGVHISGSPAIDGIKKMKVLPPAEAFAAIGAKPPKVGFLVNWQPLTRGDREGEMSAFLEGVRAFEAGRSSKDEVSFFVCSVNEEPGNELERDALEAFVREADNRLELPKNLSFETYVALMAACSATIGNSSSGLYEAPAIGAISIDVGTRQEGRHAPAGCFRVTADPKKISETMNHAIGAKGVDEGYYGTGRACARISRVVDRWWSTREKKPGGRS